MREISLRATVFVALGLLAMPMGIGSHVRAQEKADPSKKPVEKVTYQDHILPIFRAKCGACHSSDQAKGGLVLDSYTGVMQGGSSGEVVKPTDLDASYLWKLVTHQEEPAMPPKEPKLPGETLEMIRKWIADGALENSGSKVRVKKPDFSLAMTTISTGRPAGEPPMPVGLGRESLTVTPRGNAVTGLAVNPWSPVAAVSGHKQILLYDVRDSRLIGALPFPEGVPHVLKFSRNGSLLLAGGGRGGQSGRVIVFDVKTGKRVFEVGDEYDTVLAADISADHKLVALGGPRRMVRVFSTADGVQKYEIKKHTDWVTALEFSPDGVLLATGDRSNGLLVWEAATGQEFYNLTGHAGPITGISWRNDSNAFASSSEDATIKLWEMLNGRLVKSWVAHSGGVGNLCFSRDGRITSTGRDKTVKVFDQNGTALKTFSGLADLGLESAFASEEDLVLAGDWSGNVRVWDVKTGVEQFALSTNPAALAARVTEAKELATKSRTAADQAKASWMAQKNALEARTAAAAARAQKAVEAENELKAAQAATAEANKGLPVARTAQTAAQTAATAAKQALDKALAAKTAAEKEAAAAPEDKKPELTKAAEAKTVEWKQAADKSTAAEAALTKAKADLATAEKLVADTAKRLATAGNAVPAAKAAATAAANAAKFTPQQLKAVSDAEAAAKVAEEMAVKAAARAGKLEEDQKVRAAGNPNATAAAR